MPRLVRSMVSHSLLHGAKQRHLAVRLGEDTAIGGLLAVGRQQAVSLLQIRRGRRGRHGSQVPCGLLHAAVY